MVSKTGKKQGRGPCDRMRPSRPPGAYFLYAQKVTKDAQEADGFLTSFPVGKRDSR